MLALGIIPSIAHIIKINNSIMEGNENNKRRAKKKLPVNDIKMSAIDSAQINELLIDSIQNYVRGVKKKTKDSEEAVKIINNHVSEFLQAFMIFGYDMKGDPICIHHANTQIDSDALSSLMSRVIFNRGE
jgi:hypothetical protein